MKPRPIIEVKMTPTPDGWQLWYTHRLEDGGTWPAIAIAANLDAAIEHVKHTCAVHGIQTNPPTRGGRL